VRRSGSTFNWAEKGIIEKEIIMREQMLKLQTKIQILLNDNGQDLIEYALVVALICFAATAGMGTVANSINNAFGNIGARLVAYVGN
jgi:pilus assembly protein Flp/PilA